MKLQKTDHREVLIISTSTETCFLDLENIIRFQSDSNYTSIFTTNHRKPLFISKTLKHFERILADSFFIRIHQSHMVNSKKIVQYVMSGNSRVLLNNHDEIAVSRSKRALIKRYLQENTRGGIIHKIHSP